MRNRYRTSLLVTTVFLLLSSCGGEVPEGLMMPEIVEMSETASANEVTMTCALTPSANVSGCVFVVAQGSTEIAMIEVVNSHEGVFSATVSGLRQDTGYSWSVTYTNGKDEGRSDARSFRTEKLPYDPTLWEAILDAFDKDGDGSLSEDEKLEAREFRITDIRLTSLSGIEELKYLERLTIAANGLRAPDVSGLKNLEFLSCGRDNYENVIFDNPKLSYVYIIETPLTTLDTSGLPALDYLDAYNNPFETLSFASNPRMSHIILVGAVMEALDLSTNPGFDIIYVRENDNLRVLWLHPDCKPSSIDLNENTQIKYKQ